MRVLPGGISQAGIQHTHTPNLRTCKLFQILFCFTAQRCAAGGSCLGRKNSEVAGAACLCCPVPKFLWIRAAMQSRAPDWWTSSWRPMQRLRRRRRIPGFYMKSHKRGTRNGLKLWQLQSPSVHSQLELPSAHGTRASFCSDGRLWLDPFRAAPCSHFEHGSAWLRLLRRTSSPQALWQVRQVRGRPCRTLLPACM